MRLKLFIYENKPQEGIVLFFPVMGQRQCIFKGRMKLITPHPLLLGAHSAFSGRANQIIDYFAIRLRHLKNVISAQNQHVIIIIQYEWS